MQITYDFTEQTKLPHGLTEEDGEKLKKDLILITDKRDSQKTSIPYDTQTEKVFFNCTDTGLYEILLKAGTFEKCLVIAKPQGGTRRETFLTVIRLSTPRNWRNIASRSLWAVSRYDAIDWTKWFEGLPSDTAPTTGKYFIVIGPNGDATLPFRVKKDLGVELEGDAYEVSFDSYCPGPYDLPTGNQDYGQRLFDPRDEGNDHGQRIHLNAKDGASFRSNRGDVFVPKGFKVLAIETEEEPDEDADSDSDDTCCLGESKNPPIVPGNIMDVELNIMGKTAEFSIWNDGTHLEINRGPRIGQLDGLISLVRDHGFREDVARGIIKRSVAQRKFTCRVIYPAYLVKSAADPYLAGQGPTAPAFPPTPYGGNSIMGSSVQTQMPQEDAVPVPGMAPEMGNRAMYDPTQNLTGPEKNQLNTAVGSGQKEIFDTSMIGSMLKAVRDDTMVGRSRYKNQSFIEEWSLQMAKLHEYADLTGQRFGRLIVLGLAERRALNGAKKGSNYFWTVRCECGEVKTVMGQNLRRGLTKSCGCLQREFTSTMRGIVQLGMRFGRWLTVKKSSRQGFWHCECDCGQQCEISAGSLLCGDTQSCGCLRDELAIARLTTHGQSDTAPYNRTLNRNHAERKRGLHPLWTIGMELALQRLQPKCVVCSSGDSLQVDHVCPLSHGFVLAPGNAVVLCRRCNSRKYNKFLDQLPDYMAMKIATAAEEFKRHWIALSN